MNKINLILPDIRSAYNVGSILRSAEIFSVNHIFFVGYTPYPKIKEGDKRLPHVSEKVHRKISKTSLGAEQIVPFSVYDTIDEAIKIVKQSNSVLYALELSPKSQLLNKTIISDDVTFILGNEIDGIDKQILDRVDKIIEIPQFGKKESLNVAAACSILLYDLRTRKL